MAKAKKAKRAAPMKRKKVAHMPKGYQAVTPYLRFGARLRRSTSTRKRSAQRDNAHAGAGGEARPRRG